MAVPIEVVSAKERNNSERCYARLLPALRRLDQLMERAIAAAQSSYPPEAAADPYRGLYLNLDEISRLLAREPGVPTLWTSKHDSEDQHQAVASEFNEVPALAVLERSFGLSEFDLDVILIALAAEIDLRYERIFAYLQDDVTKRRPSVDLTLNVLCASPEEKLRRRAHFTPDSPLIHQDLVRLIPDPSQVQPPLLAHYLKLDEQVTRLLIGQKNVDPRLVSFCQMVSARNRIRELPLSSEMKLALPVLVRQARETRQPMRFYFSGNYSGDQLSAAEALAAEIDLPLLVADLSRAVAVEADFPQALKLVFREAWFQDAVLYLCGVQALQHENRAFQSRLLWATLADHNGIVILAGEQGWLSSQVIYDFGPLGLITVPFAIPSVVVRRECWQTALDAANISLPEPDLQALAGRFRLTSGQIREAVADARNKAVWRGATSELDHSSGPSVQPIFVDLCAAARAQSQHQLGMLARKIEPSYAWSDIVLPQDALDQLRELCSRVTERHRVLGEWGFGRKLSLGKGVSALFAGPSGTGKTLAAEIIARELELHLYKIDLSSVVSKYIGETEKNLDRIFAAAENSNGIVFIDECDSLMGKRSEVRDAHDRYANIEIAYLLQKMEEYEGIVILATNLRQNLDESFVRRLAFTIHFPFPDETHRRLIWEKIWPDATPRADDLDLNFLSRQFKLSGGNIKNIALAGAFLAAADGGVVRMAHLIQATRREYQKLGKPLGPAELGSFAEATA